MRSGSITASSGSFVGPSSAASIPSRAIPTTIAAPGDDRWGHRDYRWGHRRFNRYGDIVHCDTGLCKVDIRSLLKGAGGVKPAGLSRGV